MRRTPAYIICSPRPQVGKTLIARLLCEFLLLQRGGVIGFDVNLKEPTLLDFLPRTTETAEIDDTFGKMALMDRLILNDGTAKVIDLGFHAFDEFFRMTGEIGFFKEAARRGIVPMVLFVWGPGRIVPVRVTSLSIKETLYDPILLNPTQATATVGLQVLTPEVLANTTGILKDVSVAAWNINHALRQALAIANLANAVESSIGMLPF